MINTYLISNCEVRKSFLEFVSNFKKRLEEDIKEKYNKANFFYADEPDTLIKATLVLDYEEKTIELIAEINYVNGYLQVYFLNSDDTIILEHKTYDCYEDFIEDLEDFIEDTLYEYEVKIEK